MLLAQISDLHILRPGRLAYGRVDTSAHLARCVARLNALEPRPDAVLITGYLVDSGGEEEYLHLRQLLAPLEIPYYLMVGNHDARGPLRKVFGAHRRAGPIASQDDDFVQYSFDVGPVRVIALDSQTPGESGGSLCDARVAWLSAQLDAARDRPVIVALHHPPFASGIEHMDEIALDRHAAQRLDALLRRHPNVERVIFGHVHRTLFARFGGTLASGAPSPAHQVRLDLRPGAPPAFCMEPPGFALHRYTRADGLVTHHVYVDPAAGPYPFEDIAAAAPPYP